MATVLLARTRCWVLAAALPRRAMAMLPSPAPSARTRNSVPGRVAASLTRRATGSRQLLAQVKADERALRERSDQRESHVIAGPAANWSEAAGKARYLIGLYATGALMSALLVYRKP